jgi:hypothetical protein
MKMKSMNRILATCLAGMFLGSVANAAQVILPKHVSGASNASSNEVISTTIGGGNPGKASVTLPAGQSLTFDVEYSVTTPQTGDESGLGLKVRYNSAFFQDATIANVTNLFTKCMIAAPSPQTTSVSGFDREVVFGWLDTSIRRTSGTPSGAVGWPAQVDPTALGDECLDPGSIANDTGAQSTPKVLFRISLQSKPGSTSGSSNISITSDGNVSYAKATGVTEATTGSLAETNRTIAVNGAAAPLATLTKVLSRKVHSTTAAATSPAFDFVLWDSATGAAPTSIASGAAVKTEPRNPVNAGAVGTAGHLIVFKYTANVSGTPSVSSTAGTIGTVTVVGDEVRIPLTNVTDIARALVTVNGVGDDKAVAIGFLAGNVNSFTTTNMATNSTDIGQVKGQSGAPAVTSTNFVFDVNANGAINSTDIGQVKGKSGNQLP